MTAYIGIDNGVTGSIGGIKCGATIFVPMPTFVEQNYTKKKGNITRVDATKLDDILYDFTKDAKTVKIMMERPMVNPKRFAATRSALRALEATLVVINFLDFPITYIDSKEWQKEMLPKGVKGPSELKKASRDIACRLFPKHKKQIKRTNRNGRDEGDGDGILIAEYCRRFFK